MNASQDFTVERGVLLIYHGNARTVTVPKGVKRIGRLAFSGAYDTKRVVLPEGLVEIGDEAFDGADNLREVVLPFTLKRIGTGAFHGCRKLRRIDLPEGFWEDVILQTSSVNNIDYYFNEEYLFSFTQYPLKPSDNYVDNEDVDVKYIKINGNDATTIEYLNKEERYILWSDGEYSYYIVSTECDIETLIGYAESVK